MFFYIYADYFQLWQPGLLQGMLEGRRPFAGSPHSFAGDVLRDGSSLPDAVSLRRSAGAT